jgi:CHAT domain-containing protein
MENVMPKIGSKISLSLRPLYQKESRHLIRRNQIFFTPSIRLVDSKSAQKRTGNQG